MSELFKRFQKAWDTRYDREPLLCFHCENAETYTTKQELGSLAHAYTSWPNYQDGCLIDTNFRPDPDNEHCQHCFDGWVEEKMDEGKICISCRRWLEPKPKGMTITTRDAETKRLHSKRVMCEECFAKALDKKIKEREVT